MVENDCVLAGLAPFIPDADNPWDESRLQHLFLRTAFGIDPFEVDDYLNRSPSEVVDEIVDEAINLPLPPQPDWHDWTRSDYDDDNQIIEQLQEWITRWLTDMWDHGLRDKLALFWHNHFVTEIESHYCPSYMYSYHKLLQTYALGNFKEFTVEMGKTPAMLVYLNGVQSTRFEPNENYARELFELFTLGRDNGYTQMDITEAARALTGWNGFSEACAPISYVSSLHDDGAKTIFGQTGNFDYQGLHDLLFDLRQDEIAEFICTKIYTFFIGKEINEDIINGLKQVFLDNDFEIAPVVRTLLKSEFFFDQKQFGTQISSPVDLLLSHTKRLNYKPEEEEFRLLNGALIQLGQRLFNPPNVAGWPGDQNWLNTSLITNRWSIMDLYIGVLYRRNKEKLADFGRSASTSYSNVGMVCQEIIHFLIPWGLPLPQDYEAALEVFKGDIPENYFETGQWNVDWDTMADQTALLIQHLSRLPEYQLK
jgi:uncharacterized protein (DUF1800 family)